MKNCIILGSGRSGTSLAAGVLGNAGYFMGERMMKPTESNPKGYFESFDIQNINESIISTVIPSRPKGFAGSFFPFRPGRSQRWLARVKLDAVLTCPDRIRERIEYLTDQQPFCFKDPRFCYTLPVWRPYLRNTVYICVFRDPAVTAASILKDCRTAPYMKNLFMNFSRALKVWELMYLHILSIHRHEGSWLFLHYDQVLNEDGLDRIEKHLEAKTDSSFPDKSLKRSSSMGKVSYEVEKIYNELCALAGYKKG